MTDAELVERAQRGDASAFGLLVERHQSAVLRAARAVCRTREEAEDVAQDAFVTAWQKLHTFRGDAQFKTWLLTIAWRQALTRRESVWRRIRRFVSTDREEYVEPILPVRSTEQQLVDRAIVDAVRTAVESLPRALREALLLSAGGSCTYEEMSAMLGVPSGTLKWRVMEARRRLKRDLAARGFEWA